MVNVIPESRRAKVLPLARWLERIQQYDFEIFHRKRKLYGNDDGLSRRPCEEENCAYCYKVDFKQEDVIGRIVFETDNLESWRKDQLEDPALTKILQGKETDRRPPWQEIILEGPSAKVYWLQWDSLILRECRIEDGNSLILRRICFRQ